MEEAAASVLFSDVANAAAIGAGVNYASAKMGTQSYSAGTLTGGH